jgi:uncharacterized protein (TIGR02145 family)
MDFVNKMQIAVLDSKQVLQGDSVSVDLTPIQWLSDTCKNLQTIYIKIPIPQKEGTYDMVLIVNGKRYETKKAAVITHKSPYFTSFVIPGASIDNADSYVSATLKGKNFKNAGLDISALNLEFSKDYENMDTLKYEAALLNDSTIMLKIYIPQNVGSYEISAHYDEANITSLFTVVGTCSVSQEGKLVQKDGTYNICKSGNWVIASPLEQDVYEQDCPKDGRIISGKVTSSNKYVCDADTFRVANTQETELNKGCVSYNEGYRLLSKEISSTTKWYYVCENGTWQFTPVFEYGTLTDSRDKQSYKTVVIGEQTWMAENLNYADSVNYPSMLGRNWCYNNSLDSCAKYGRYYTWAAAIDSVKLYDDGNGVDCGYGKTCKLPAKIQGICPNGWHLPDSTEWNALLDAVGGASDAGKVLKSTTDWKNYKGTDVYGFSAMPAGYAYSGYSVYSVGEYARFWSSTERNGDNAYNMYLYYSYDYVYFSSYSKTYGFSVRCVKD